MTVRSPSGVVWQASVAAGSHGITVSAVREESWELVELDGNDLDGSLVGEVPAEVWSSGDAVLLSVEDRGGRLQVTATPIDNAEFTTRLDEIADRPPR